MTDTLKVRKVGNSLGAILPKDITDVLHVKEGDELYVTRTPDGIKVTPYDPEFAATLEDAREFMRTHRDTFRALAR